MKEPQSPVELAEAAVTPATQEPEQKKSPRRMLGILAVIVVAAGELAHRYQLGHYVETTDDARLQSYAVTVYAIAEARRYAPWVEIGTETAEQLAISNPAATALTAGVDGRIGDQTVRVGQFVQQGTRLMSLIPSYSLSVIANFKETQIGYMQAGQTVGVTITGHAEQILALARAALTGEFISLHKALGRGWTPVKRQ